MIGYHTDRKYEEIEDDVDDDSSSVKTSDMDSNESSAVGKKISIEEWVKERNGNQVIRKLLIANNGLSAVKCIYSLRQWCYQTFGDRSIIHFVVMATPEDIQVLCILFHKEQQFDVVLCFMFHLLLFVIMTVKCRTC